MRGESRFWVIGSVCVLAATMALVAAGAMPRAVVAHAQTAAGAEILLSDAQRFEREGDLDRAFRQYELIVEQFPESAVTPRALLALGQGRWSRGEVDAARAATANLRSAYPRSPSAAGAFVLEGDIALARAQGPAELSAARDTFGGVPRLFETSEYPALEWRALAILRTGEISLLLGEFDEAAAAFLALIENEPPSAQTAAGARGLFRQWFLLDTDPRRVVVFADDARYLTTLAGNLGEPVDLATDSRGRVHVLDQETNSVIRFDADGSPVGRVLVGTWRRAQALDIDELGHLYILDRDENEIHVFSQTGQPLEVLGPQLPGGVELRDPRDLAVDGTGRLYIADRAAATIVILE